MLKFKPILYYFYKIDVNYINLAQQEVRFRHSWLPIRANGKGFLKSCLVPKALWLYRRATPQEFLRGAG